jgi:ParB/RepB/Spo0J family partition protein
MSTVSEKVTLPESPGEMLQGEQIRLNLDDIWIDPSENIRNMDLVTEEEIEELAASIYGAGGLLQGLGVVKIKPEESLKYLSSIHGERWSTNIPCTVLTIKSVGEYRIAQLAENLQREDINPIEKAKALKAALEDETVERSQKEVASMVGLSDANVSQLLSFLHLPEDIVKMMQGLYRDAKGELVSQTLSFSHGRLILAHVPPDSKKQIAAAKVGLTRTYGQFEKYLNEKFGSDEESDGDDDDDSSSTTSQRSARLLTASDLEKSYMPFAKERWSKANDSDKKYSAKEMWARVIDTLKTVKRDSGTALAKDIGPFLQEQAKKEEEERAKKDNEKIRGKWFGEKVRFINQLMEMSPDETGKRPYPELSDAMAPVLKSIEEMSDEVIAALGFPLEKEKFQEEMLAAWSEDRKAKLDSKAKREKAKKEKAEKEAVEKAAAEAKAKGEEAPAA